MGKTKGSNIMRSIPKPIPKQQAAGKGRYGYWGDRKIAKATLDRIFRHWQALGWVNVSSSPLDIITVWRNYR